MDNTCGRRVGILEPRRRNYLLRQTRRCSVKPLPKSDLSLVLRTDFSSDAAWNELVALLREPVDGFYAYVAFVDDRDFEGATVEQLVEAGCEADRSFVIVADASSMQPGEHSLLVVDLFEEPGSTFRTIPAQLPSVENNLFVANVFFREFTDAADADGVFRRFP